MDGDPMLVIPPTKEIRQKLGAHLRAVDVLKQLLRVAEKRDKMVAMHKDGERNKMADLVVELIAKEGRTDVDF